mmetsp:Transcript_2425/g.6175  ORF Transcript_2425/g.6175 Transcript_2425/m.6175 type:complete len:743 (-) Transcript_2425:468-2696(-)
MLLGFLSIRGCCCCCLRIAHLHVQGVGLVSTHKPLVDHERAANDDNDQGNDAGQSHPAGDSDGGAVAGIGVHQHRLQASSPLHVVDLLHDGVGGLGVFKVGARVLGRSRQYQLAALGCQGLALHQGLGQAAADHTNGEHGAALAAGAAGALGLHVAVAVLGEGCSGLVVPQGQAHSAAHLRLAAVSQLLEVLHQALEHQRVAAQLGLGVLAVGVHVVGAVGEDANVVAVVGLHHVLTRLQLLLALLTKVGLGHVLHQALDDASLAGLDVLAVHGLLLGAQLVELGAQADVAVLDGSQLHLLVTAGFSELVAVEAQARVHAALTWLYILAVLLHIIAAGLSQDDVVAEVSDLHELIVEHLVLAGLTSDVVLLLLQALQHQATAHLAGLGGAHVGAHLVDVGLARVVQAPVEAVVGGHAVHVAHHLVLALLGHVAVVQVLLQAPDDAGVAVGHVLAKAVHLPGARLLHGVLEVNVLSHAHLVVKQRCSALLGQAVAVVLQAADDPGRAGLHVIAELGAVIIAGIGQDLIKADVTSCTLHAAVHLRLALLALELLLVLLQAVQGCALDLVVVVHLLQGGTAGVLEIRLAGVTHSGIQAEIGHPLGDGGLQLLLAISGKPGLVHVVLKALLGLHVAWLDILAELLIVGQALVEQADTEAQIGTSLLLRLEHLVLALPRHLDALGGQALQLTAITSLNILAQVGDIVLACRVQLGVHLPVLGCLLLDAEHLSLACCAQLGLLVPEAS